MHVNNFTKIDKKKSKTVTGSIEKLACVLRLQKIILSANVILKNFAYMMRMTEYVLFKLLSDMEILDVLSLESHKYLR